MTIEERLEAIEARCRKAEDHLEILNLLNAYGPLVDCCAAQEAADLWIEGGTYNLTMPDGAALCVTAPGELADVYAGDVHLALTEAGSAHLTATPRVTIDGDSAQALAYSFVVLREGERWIVWRAAINHWTLARTDAGWRIAERFNRPLDGSRESRDTLRRVLAL